MELHCPSWLLIRRFVLVKLYHRNFVPPKTFMRNKTPLEMHMVQVKTFLRNGIVLESCLMAVGMR